MRALSLMCASTWKPSLGSSYRHLQAAWLILAGVLADEVGISEQLFQIGAHLFAAARAGVAGQSGFGVGDELIEFVSHGVSPGNVSSRYFPRNLLPDASGFVYTRRRMNSSGATQDRVFAGIGLMLTGIFFFALNDALENG